ncbi:hypothetical protein ACB092_11G101800 [Castanea dentata]
MEEDWDLQAVVRGCVSTASRTNSSTTAATTTASTSFMSDFHYSNINNSYFSGSVGEQLGLGQGQLFSFSDPFEARRHVSEDLDLHELCKPFFPKSEPLSPQLSPLTSFSNSLSSFTESKPQIQQQQQQKQHQHQGQQQQQQQQQKQQTKQSQSGSASNPKSKRRKNLLKKVCHVPAEGLSSDIWAWRKYGQKPIKGSPYPRGYYRCSSSKGCLARKQVERNKTDPGMFIVTYTGEHNHPAPTHRNSLAGSTRQKPLTPQNVTAGDPNKAQKQYSSPETSFEEELVVPQTQTQSTTTDSKEEEEEEEEEEREDLVEEDDEEGDEFGISDMVLNDDFFIGLDGFAGPGTGDYFPDNFPASFAPISNCSNWVANNAG